MMTIASYMNLPYDLSGSLSKNRFRNEMLWGLKKILELYRTNKDFTVVFDYKCDVEVHLSDRFEFYQLKTQNDFGTYTINNLIKKNKSGDSVLGKVYILKYNENGDEQDEILVAVVSNAPLNDGIKVHTNCESVLLLDIDEEAIKKVKESITKELIKQQDVKLTNTFFLRTSMDLINPEKTLIGELALFFEDIFNTEVNKINSLYRVLYSEISSKASYELELITYDEILNKKGINRVGLTRILNKYIDNTDNAINKTRDYIDNYYKDNFKIRFELKKALNQVLIHLSTNKSMRMLEQKIADYITYNIGALPDTDSEIVELIYNTFLDNKPIEMNNGELKILVLITLKRYEEGLYEKSVS
ncbi:dsDNA nuclease domain-containing protein [Ammoniphilus sp. CFH 90114]|uniref:dsDNA nuclease domain-containing protein n=1 Tax=Ammoniphilus sp. CFH 90114 TaxID=2493665 RepID=UPI00100FFB3A|nr:dsDNA nuclease domain-containing protein [Ammoniphilus sp. CFH 90114]RXT08841.1 DUF4297 domain-containing protein [Ammoniphilus sp. CFH 90114]